VRDFFCRKLTREKQREDALSLEAFISKPSRGKLRRLLLNPYDMNYSRRTVMAMEKCAICDKEIDTEHYLNKKCAKCGSWFCHDHLGPYKFQCAKCLAYALSNIYGS
jgi:predicted nucleic acid binding AN1-type Zn finger protein